MTLIKYVATAMPFIACHHFCFLQAGERRPTEFSRISRNFTPKGWNAICLPKKLEGLGLRKMHETNRPLLQN